MWCQNRYKNVSNLVQFFVKWDSKIFEFKYDFYISYKLSLFCIFLIIYNEIFYTLFFINNVTINHSLKIKIIADYLSGMKREDIAKKYGVSTGSVAAIAEEFEEEIPDIDKLRTMMIKLNDTGNSPKTFYHAIRLHNYIKNLGLTMVQAENILEILQEYAFKNNYNLPELIDAVINAYSIAQRCRTDLEHLEEYANAKAMVVEGMETQVRKLRYDIEYLPYKLNIDLAEYQEYQRNQPFFQKFMNMITESDIKDRRIKLLEEEKK